MNTLLPLTVAVPLGTGFITALLPKKLNRVSDIIAVFSAGVILLNVIFLFGYEGIYEMGGWNPPMGISLYIDSFSWLMLIGVSSVGFLLILYSVKYMSIYTSRNRYYVLFFMMIAGINGTLLAGDIFNRFVYVELAAISSYILVGFGCSSRSLSAAIKFTVLGALASAVTLFSIAILYALYGTVNIAHLGAEITNLHSYNSFFNPLTLSAFMMVIGFGIKAAVIPFHIWQPDALETAPSPAAAAISTILITSTGVYAMLRTAYAVFNSITQLPYLIAFIGLISVVFGTLYAYSAETYKKTISYHSISQIGYIILGLGLGGSPIVHQTAPEAAALAATGSLFHIINYLIFTPVLFLKEGVYEYLSGKEKDSNTDYPTVSKAGIFSLAGIPPFGGFISKLMIIAACFMTGGLPGIIAGIIASAAAVHTVLSLTKKDLLKLKTSLELKNIPGFMKTPILFLSFMCLASSLLFLPVLRQRFLEPARTNIIPIHEQKPESIKK